MSTADTSTRPRTGQHSRRNGPSSSRDAGRSTGIVCSPARTSSSATVASICRGTPSSNGMYRGSSTVGVRACSCRKRSRIRSTHPGLGSSSVSVRLRVGSVPSDSGVSTPNCQRSRFFCADAR